MGIIVFIGLAFRLAWAQGPTDYADPQSPIGFAGWLWITVACSGLCGLGFFYIMHKRWWPRDTLVPLPVSVVFAYLFVLVPHWGDNNIYGWFGRDCFHEYIVSGDREVAEGGRASECVEARENIKALGIRFAIRNSQESFLEFRPLTTREIEVVYATLIAVWTLCLTGFLLYL
ncbi:MAG: hypothetical protein ACRERU_22615 [Methylococcales bacterium]